MILPTDINANKGLEIAIKSDRNFDGYEDSSSEMTMELISKKGDVVTRKLKFKRLEVPGDGDKSLAVFESPRDVKGVAILSFAHKTEPDDQWLYLPALKRVKRIASKNKSGPFSSLGLFGLAPSESLWKEAIKSSLLTNPHFSLRSCLFKCFHESLLYQYPKTLIGF